MIKFHRGFSSGTGRVVVLGSSGFIGKNLKRELSKDGIDVLGVSSADVDLTQTSSIGALEKIVVKSDALVITSMVTPDRGKDADTQLKNILMGRNISLFLERHPCAHGVYLSSDAVYPDESGLLSEDSPCGPSTLYGVAHLARERMLMDASKKSCFPLLVLRPAAIYGPGDTHNSYGPNRLLRNASTNRKITLFGRGEEKRDHVYIRDLCRLIVLCLKNKSEGILNVATGKSISFFEVASLVKELVGEDVQIECAPRASPITHRHFDIAETLKAFPANRFTTLKDGLSETLKASLVKA